jgi:serine/threonine protein phosphatase PrpC
MTLSEGFVLAAGSVTGRDHRRAQRDGQDGFALRASTKADVVAAVVTDGCSSGRTSEVGARLGAAWIAGLIEQRFALVADEDAARVAAQRVVEGLVERLRDLAASLGADAQIVGEMLLFGFLAIAITKGVTIVFGVGDGAAAIDGAVTVIDPGPDNAPAYAAYALLGTHIEPRVLFVGSAECVAVATDGVDAKTLVEVAADPRLDKNASLLRKRMIVLADEGRFDDDATVAVVRRRRIS